MQLLINLYFKHTIWWKLAWRIISLAAAIQKLLILYHIQNDYWMKWQKNRPLKLNLDEFCFSLSIVILSYSSWRVLCFSYPWCPKSKRTKFIWGYFSNKWTIYQWYHQCQLHFINLFSIINHDKIWTFMLILIWTKIKLRLVPSYITLKLSTTKIYINPFQNSAIYLLFSGF